MPTITRIGFCEACAKSRSPRTGQLFMAWGSKSDSYHIYEAKRNGVIGFVPFIYDAKVIGYNVIVEKCCSVVGCGVQLSGEDASGQYYEAKHWVREMWTLDRWNSLVILKHNFFTFQYEI